MKTINEIILIIAEELGNQAELGSGNWFSNYNLFTPKYNDDYELDGVDHTVGFDGSIDLLKLVEKLKELDIIQYSEDETANKLDQLISEKKVVI